MNRVEYGSYLFTDSNIMSGDVYLSNSMAFDALDVDTLELEVVSNDIGNRRVFTVEGYQYRTSDGAGYVIVNKDIRNYKYGDPITYYYDGQLVGKFYIRNIVRKDTTIFKINAISVVGIWYEMTYLGGIYDGITVRELINDILPGWNLKIDPAVANVLLYGWLRIQSVADSICEILFATGASLLKDTDGSPKLAFLDNLPTVEIPREDVYIGGSVDYRSPATTVNITEHSFYQSVNDKVVNLFDNTDGSGSADEKLITFEKPCYDLKWDGATLPSGWKHGANYCYVTGTGVLTGKEYTHSTKIFSVDTDVQSEPKEVWIKEATLVSATNSANVAARVIDYRSKAEEVSFDIVLNNKNIKPGTKVKFIDPYKETTEGLVADMEIEMSGILKAATKVIKNYTPGHFGNNFTKAVLFTESQYWTPPQGTQRIRMVIAGGGQAGQNGTDGKPSTSSTWFNIDFKSGEGGLKGVAGSPGKILVVDIENPSGEFRILVGKGGQPGENEGEVGELGSLSRVTVTTDEGHVYYSSTDGAVPNEGFRDVLSGKTYAIQGKDGINGGKGREYYDTNCGDVTHEGQTWYAGKNNHNHESGSKYDSYGSYGSGAAYGANGLDGIPASGKDYGAAVHGADALPYDVEIELASGGWGGHGGGGAGSPGWRKDSDGDYTSNKNARGGYHSKGTPGGNGFVLIYM